MDRVQWSGRTMHDTKAIGPITRRLVKVNSFILMETFMKGTG